MLYTFIMKSSKIDNLNIIYLANLYGNLLTANQRNMLSLFYDADCSLGEIAEQYAISRQAVRDTIKKAEMALLLAEEKLGIFSKMKEINLIATKCKQSLSMDDLVVRQALDAILEITEV